MRLTVKVKGSETMFLNIGMVHFKKEFTGHEDVQHYADVVRYIPASLSISFGCNEYRLSFKTDEETYQKYQELKRAIESGVESLEMEALDLEWVAGCEDGDY